MKTRFFGLMALLIVWVFTLTGCNKQEEVVEEKVWIANPASVFCVENGGNLSIESAEDGEIWICTFEDGSSCEEWSFIRWECKKWDSLKSKEYEIDYGTSDIYSQEDMDAAVAAIMNTFENDWEVRCEMHKLTYAGDERSQEELPNLQLRSDAPYAQAIVMLSDFHTPANPEEAMAFEPDYEYTNYNWILGRTENGEWKVMDWWY